MALITVPIIFSYSGSFQEVVGGATAVYVLTTRPLTAAPDCLRVQTEDSAAAFSALCQQALNQTVVNVLGLVVVDSATYSLMVSFLDCCYTVYFIVSMITFFNLVKRYTMGTMARVGSSLCFGRSLVFLCGVFFGVLTHLYCFFSGFPPPTIYHNRVHAWQSKTLTIVRFKITRSWWKVCPRTPRSAPNKTWSRFSVLNSVPTKC